MKISFYKMIIAIGIIAVAGTFLATGAEAGGDEITLHFVNIDVFDMYGDYCHTITYNYSIPDTTTTHYEFYHRGPTVPDTHDDGHLAVITDTYNWNGIMDLDTLCNGDYPIYA